MEDALVQCIELSLANCLTSNAAFFAEQLVALSRPNGMDMPSEHSLHLLAMCYIQAGKHSIALELLKDCNSPKNLYLRAVAAIALFRYSEAELALQPGDGVNCDDDYKLVPNGAYGIYLLGVVKRRLGTPKLAVKYFRKALELNPLLWCAYENLCQLGVTVDPTEYFGSEEQLLALQSISQQDPVVEVAQTGKGPAKAIPKVSAQFAPERVVPPRKAIATPALAKKMRVAMSPGDTQGTKGGQGQSLARRLFETPRTPAESMLGISTSTPLWAPVRGPRPAGGPIAMRLPGESSMPPPASSSVLSTPLAAAHTTFAATPARGATLATPGPSKGAPSAASPKKRAPAAASSSNVSSVRASTGTAKSTAKDSAAPAPTPRRAASSVATSTPAANAKTTRVMPARAVKARTDKTTISAAHMTPIPSSLTTIVANNINTSTPTTPPVVAASGGPVAAPSKAVEPKQPPPPRGRHNVSRPFPKKTASDSDDEDDTTMMMNSSAIPAFVISSTPIAAPPSSSSIGESSTATMDEPSTITVSGSPTVDETADSLSSTGKEPLPPMEPPQGTSFGESRGVMSGGVSSRLSSIPAGFSPLSNASEDGEGDRNEELDVEETWVKSMAALLAYLRQLGEATRLAEKYDCEKALAAFGKLPFMAKESPYVMASIGKCYYEMSDQERARDAFFMLRKRWPCSFLHMALYSNILWHLREKADLSALAHDLTKLDPRSAEAWCAMGNSFSLEGDLENAILAFKRASQVNPSFTYTYVLAGHEHLAKDEYDLAVLSFREALNLDIRHYRAWYGLGLAAYRQQKLIPARAHLLRALEIFPGAATISTALGLVCAASEQIQAAANYFSNACNLSPKSPHAKYHLASMYVSLSQMRPDNTWLTKAHILLDELNRMLPRCGALHLLKGRILKAKENLAEAEEEFSMAKELDSNVEAFFEDVIVIYDPPEIA
jgi:tetratricopeptide (TPR) repeat protein